MINFITGPHNQPEDNHHNTTELFMKMTKLSPSQNVILGRLNKTVSQAELKVTFFYSFPWLNTSEATEAYIQVCSYSITLFKHILCLGAYFTNFPYQI